jgi:hypothetical protein
MNNSMQCFLNDGYRRQWNSTLRDEFDLQQKSVEIEEQITRRSRSQSPLRSSIVNTISFSKENNVHSQNDIENQENISLNVKFRHHNQSLNSNIRDATSNNSQSHIHHTVRHDKRRKDQKKSTATSSSRSAMESSWWNDMMKKKQNAELQGFVSITTQSIPNL